MINALMFYAKYKGSNLAVFVPESDVELLRSNQIGPRLVSRFLDLKYSCPEETDAGTYWCYVDPESGTHVMIPETVGGAAKMEMDVNQLQDVSGNVDVPGQITAVRDRETDIALALANRLMEAATTTGPAFIGKGKLTEYSGKGDSWILDQMDKGTPEPGIGRKRDEDNQIRFSNSHERKVR